MGRLSSDYTASDHKIYAQLKKLVELQLHAKGFDLLPKQASHSILSGRHASRLRGRGLSFEELRAYRVGDDIRTLDWKVSNRMRKPHVRVYSEERERDVLLLVDQRPNMFFGSRQYMKSVTAAELAALAIWRVLALKDRVGALVFNDQAIEKSRPQRSNKSAMRILHNIITFNHQLSAEQNKQHSGQLNRVLFEAEHLCGHDCLVILVSDMQGWDQETIGRVKRIKAHNDVIVSLVYDPLERDLPEHNQLIVSDGQLQIEIDTRAEQLNEQFAKGFSNNIESLTESLSKYAIPLLLLDTVRPVHQQFGVERGLSKRPASKKGASL